MKRLLIKLLVGVLALGMLVTGLVACGSNSGNWTKPTLTNAGNGSIYGGFIGETDNYFYFINGVATSTDDNAFGAPIKGALMVQDKSDLSKAPQIVVPKLFASSDYNAGVYVYGGRVYYGTPCTDKNSSGNIANNEMTFMSTKIDGTDTQTYFTLGTLSAEYRIIENKGVVYIVYYDADNASLCVYNTSTKTSDTIIKTDATAEGVNARSLGAYKFLDKDAVKEGLAVAYSVIIYSEEYYESAASEEGYSRQIKKYNEVYVYGVNGDKVESEKVLDGETDKITYAITLVNGLDVFVSETDVLSKVKNASINLKDGEKKAVVNADLVATGNLLLENGDVLTLSEGVVTLRNIYINDSAMQEKLAIIESVNSLVRYDQTNAYLYYLDGTNALSRIKVRDADALPELVSEDSILTAWYAPAFVKLGEKEFVFYADGSTKGASYVKYVEVSATAKGEDTDDDGEKDKFYLEGHEFLAQRLDKDVATFVTSTINDLTSECNDSGALDFEEVEKDGNKVLTVESVVKAKELYDKQSSEVKELVSESAVENLNNYLKAIEMANVYNKLKDIKKVNELNEDQVSALKAVYEQVKGEIETFRKTDNYVAVRTLLGNDLNAYYQKAVEKFTPAVED